jgi:hypothetical protein
VSNAGKQIIHSAHLIKPDEHGHGGWETLIFFLKNEEI